MDNIMELKKQPHLSASGIRDYCDCGLQYKFGRIDKRKPEFSSDSLDFGSVIHKVLAEFYQEKMVGNKLSLLELHKIFEDHWRTVAKEKPDIRYTKGRDFETVLQEGKSLLSAYYENVPDDNFKVLAIEEPFIFTIAGVSIPIIGVFDLLLQENESDILIINEFKTSSKAYSKDDIDKSLQLTLYQMSAKANGYKCSEILLRFDILIKTKVPKFEQYYTVRSEDDEMRAIRKIQQVWDGINKGVFIPNYGSWKCNCCSYQNACNQWFLKTGTND